MVIRLLLVAIGSRKSDWWIMVILTILVATGRLVPNVQQCCVNSPACIAIIEGGSRRMMLSIAVGGSVLGITGKVTIPMFGSMGGRTSEVSVLMVAL